MSVFVLKRGGPREPSSGLSQSVEGESGSSVATSGVRKGGVFTEETRQSNFGGKNELESIS